MLPAFLDPRTVFRVLDQIDQEPPSHSAPRAGGSKQTLWILFSVAVSLLMLNYLKYTQSLEQLLVYIAGWQGRPQNYWVDYVYNSGWQFLYRYAWWGFWHVICYLLIPAIVIKAIMKQDVLDFGFRWEETHRHWHGYMYLLCPILVFVVFASHRQDFVEHYPFYHDAGRSWFDFVAWELIYLTQFICLEFFFRGYIVQSLRPHYGSAAIWIMIVPYVMIHFTKPWLEATGAIFFGLFLGILALRSRSIWGGFGVHAGVAVSMDIASLIQQDSVPQHWWPF